MKLTNLVLALALLAGCGKTSADRVAEACVLTCDKEDECRPNADPEITFDCGTRCTAELVTDIVKADCVEAYVTLGECHAALMCTAYIDANNTECQAARDAMTACVEHFCGDEDNEMSVVCPQQ